MVPRTMGRFGAIRALGPRLTVIGIVAIRRFDVIVIGGEFGRLRGMLANVLIDWIVGSIVPAVGMRLLDRRAIGGMAMRGIRVLVVVGRAIEVAARLAVRVVFVLPTHLGIGPMIVVPAMFATIPLRPPRVFGLVRRLLLALVVLLRRLARLGVVVRLVRPSSIPGFARHGSSLLEISELYCH
jgi:hypothetical protein